MKKLSFINEETIHDYRVRTAMKFIKNNAVHNIKTSQPEVYELEILLEAFDRLCDKTTTAKKPTEPPDVSVLFTEWEDRRKKGLL